MTRVMLPPPRRRRSWNVFDRWFRLHPLTKRMQRQIATLIVYGVVRNIDRSKPRQHMQLTRGGKTGGGDDWFDSFDDCFLMELQGISAGVPIGGRGLVVKPGATPEYTAGIGVCNYMQRPTFLESEEVCIWTPFAARALFDNDGQIRLGTDLADYKDDRSDLDEGAKLRLKAGGIKGDLESYGENQVRQRAQPAGGAGASATTQLEATGKATFKVDDGQGATATITMLDGAITVENSAGAKVTLQANGDVEVDGAEIRVGAGATKAAARSTDPVNPGVNMTTWATAVEAAINALAPLTFTPANTFAVTVAQPVDSGNFGSIGAGSAKVKIK